MMYAIVGTEVETRKKALASILKNKNPTYYVRKDTFFQLSALIDAQDIFGGEVIVMVEQVGSDVEGRELLKKQLPAMKESVNLFIIDEPFTDASFTKTLEKYGEVFNAKEEKSKKEFPSIFLSAFEKRDKKNAWVEWMKLRDGETELLHGALWWKVKMLWQGIKTGRRGAFTEEEIAHIGYELVSASHKAHRGEADLKEEMEKIILGI